MSLRDDLLEWPLRSARFGQAARLGRMANEVFIAEPAAQSASVGWRKSPRLVAPALLTTRSTPPTVSFAAITTVAGTAGSRRSTACTRHSVGRPFASASIGSRERAADRKSVV